MFIKPEDIIKEFGIKPGMTVADFGCGSGHYSIEAARLVKGNGVVYAIDVQKDLLATVKTRAEKEGLENVEIIWGDLDSEGGSRLANEIADRVIISNILFQAEDKQGLVNEAFRVLKKDGRAIVIDWKKEGRKMGPPMDQRVSKEEAERIFLQGGFIFDKEIHAKMNHYGLIFKKG